MDVLINILDFFEPHAIYEQISKVSRFYLMWAVPIFFALSLAARYLEVNTAALGNGASISEAVKDVLKTIMWTAIYATFGVLVLKLEVYLCALFYKQGSLSVILEHYKDLLDTAQMIGKNGDFLDSGVNLLNFGTKGAAWLLFYLSFLLLVFIYIFMRLAYAIAFALIYLWGLVAIPTMTSKLLDMSSGWTRAVISLFIWPLIEATVLMLIIPIFAAWGESLLPQGAYQEQISKAGLYILFFFCNLILSAVAIASAMMAMKIGSNQNMMSGIITPFAVTAMAGFTMWRNVTGKLTNTIGSPITTKGSKFGSFLNQQGGQVFGRGLSMGSNIFKRGLGGKKGSTIDLFNTPTDGVSDVGSSDNQNNPNSRGPGN